MTSLVLLDTAAQARRRFVNNVIDAAGRANARVLWTPGPTEGLTVFDAAVPTRVWTHANTPNGRLRPQGKGFGLAMNGTSDFMTCPDAADLSFGDSATDVPFSVFCLANITDTAAARAMFAKNGEYAFNLSATDLLTQSLVDLSVPAVPARTGNGATTKQGVTTLFSGTYSKATGGATAANDITLYENGVVVASTATNDAAYVAMENGTAVGTIGALNGGASAWTPGVLYFVMLVQANSLIGVHADVNQLCRSYFGVPL